MHSSTKIISLENRRISKNPQKDNLVIIPDNKIDGILAGKSFEKCLKELEIIPKIIDSSYNNIHHQSHGDFRNNIFTNIIYLLKEIKQFEQKKINKFIKNKDIIEFEYFCRLTDKEKDEIINNLKRRIIEINEQYKGVDKGKLLYF